MTIATNVNLSSTTPAAPTGKALVTFQDDGGSPIVNVSAYVDAAAGGLTNVALTPSAAGNFTIAHGLGVSPSSVVIQMTSGGQIWLQNPTGWDATNIYAVASAGGVTGTALCFS